MPRPPRNKLSPWIEQLILNYDGQEGNSSSGRLKAHIIGVGQMSQSQAQSSEGPTGILFLSDGVLQIPAVLTASAWEHLQEQEDRECFTSLVNTTVCIQDYRLQFSMAPEQTKCRFFLSVGELATTAAGPVKSSTPCCTTLPSVRLKIVEAWRALLGAEDSQKSQCGFDLSELLGEWQHDCLQAVLQDVQERLMVKRSPLAHPVAVTRWDVDRVRYKGDKSFSVPIKCLVMPEEEAVQLQASPNVGSRTPSGLCAASEDRQTVLPQVCKSLSSTQPSVDDAEWQIAMPAVAERGCKLDSAPLVEDCTLYEDMVVGMLDSDIRPLANPWDIFPPPCETSSSSDSSPKASPAHSPEKPSAATPKLDQAAVLTSTQLPVHSSKEVQQPSEQSFLPPYQKPPDSTSPRATAAPSSSTDEHRTRAAEQSVPALKRESETLVKDMEEIFEGAHSKTKRKRKRSETTPEQLTPSGEEDAQVSGSPPSWLFDTQAWRGARDDSGHSWDQTSGAISRKTSTVHSDGSPFSYSYQVSGQNLQDLSRFRVEESWLQWAVRALVKSLCF
uniref:Shelterin complex subunit TPP1/Est3 domain-containing protein n=1 Tax=Anabas testudineus TaxID=64144 RepID=A0A7N6BZ53_ANATE